MWRIFASFVSRRESHTEEGGVATNEGIPLTLRLTLSALTLPCLTPANHPEKTRNSTVALDADNEASSQAD